MSITRPSGRSKLGILVRTVPLSEWSESPVRAAAFVVLRDPETKFNASQSVLKRLYGLTPAESGLTAKLLDGQADYLIITHGMFTEGLAPLIAYHEGQGRTVKLVDVADIYEAYSHGVVDAAAIDAYLAAAVPALDATWVLLVGAGHLL